MKTKSLDRFTTVVIVAGKDYVAPIRAAFGGAVSYSVLLAGLSSMGAMIGVLHRSVESGQRL